MPYFDERTLLASIARRREAPEKPSMIDAKDESSPMPAADEIRSAFGQVMAAILNAVGDCPAREKAVSEEMKAHEKASEIVRSALPQEGDAPWLSPARARSGAFSLGRRWTRWGLCERRRFRQAFGLATRQQLGGVSGRIFQDPCYR
jgi:hypothetical protein